MRIVILLTVIVSMVTTYLTVRQSMKRGMMPAATPDNPMGQSQKYMAYIMPFFALSGLYWPFGLVLYWVTTNLWTLGQQYVLFMRYPMPLPAGGNAGTVPATGSVPPKLALRPPESNGSAGAGKAAGSGSGGRGQAKPGSGRVVVGQARQATGRPGQAARPGATAAAGKAGQRGPAGGRRAAARQRQGAAAGAACSGGWERAGRSRRRRLRRPRLSSSGSSGNGSRAASAQASGSAGGWYPQDARMRSTPDSRRAR